MSEENQSNISDESKQELPNVELETVHLSTDVPLVLENPLVPMQEEETGTFSTLRKKIGTLEDGTFTVSLEDVEAHPVTQMDLTEALPPTILSAHPVKTQESTEGVFVPEPESFSLAPQKKREPAADPQEHVKQAPLEKIKLQETPLSAPINQPIPTAAPVKTESLKTKEKDLAPGQKAQPVVPPQTPPAPPEKPTKRKRRWWWILVALLLVFLTIMGGFVPVENIPILRNIAHAMGFTPQEAAQMSFLRALLTWTDKTLGFNGKLFPSPALQGKSKLFSGKPGDAADTTGEEEEENALLQGKMARYTGKSSLIDMRALNELQISKGRRPDQIAGTVLLLPGQKAETQAVMRDTDVTVRTEANRDKSEVYFGNDISAINREFEDGYDSVKTLKKIANPYITDGQPIDFLMQMTQRMMKANTGLAGIDKELGTSAIGWQTDTRDVGDNKPLRDLYHAWITSRMSNYTTSIMLKKTLADASFLNAAIPTQASDSLTFGGVRIDSDSLEGDQEGWKAYLEFEKTCKEDLMKGGGKTVKDAVDDFNLLFSEDRGGSRTDSGYNVGFPKNCSDWENSGSPEYNQSEFGENIQKIQGYCKAAQAGYASLEKTCLMKVDYKSAPKCNLQKLSGYSLRFNSFVYYCKNECIRRKEKCEAQNTPSNPNACVFNEAECKAEVGSSDTWKDDSDRTYKIAETEGMVLDGVGAESDYFPQITKGGDEAQEYEDSEHRVRDTIKAGFEMNKTK